jgi:hypothetical protein
MPRGVRKRICQERRATARRLSAMPLKGKVEAPMETPFSIAGHNSDHAAEKEGAQRIVGALPAPDLSMKDRT